MKSPNNNDKIEEMSPRRQVLVHENLGLIGWAIQRFFPHVPDIDREDAWQDGFFGLVRAAKGYDFDMGLRFSTYATTWIRSSIQKGRGQANGVNFRRAISRGEVFITPSSLDKAIGGSAGQDSDFTLIDALEDLAPPVAVAATNAAAASTVAKALKAASRDAIDVAIADELIESSYEDRAFDFKKLTAQFDFSRYGIHLRRHRLIERVKKIYESGDKL